LPSGPWRGRPARGLMMLLHGGGWYIVGPGPLSTERADADRWRRRGWLTINIDYPACARSLSGVLWFHDRVRARYGRRLALCAAGASAGAHLALMLAVRRRDVGCVVGLGTPTDLRTLARDASAGGSREGSRAVFDLGRNAFGAGRLTAMSPVAQTATLRARVLLALARRDSVIPLSQAPALRRAILRRRPRAYVQSIVLAPGPIPWIHAPVSAAALRRLYAAELRLVAPLVRVRRP
jgi:acetyl esterase/lipase